MARLSVMEKAAKFVEEGRVEIVAQSDETLVDRSVPDDPVPVTVRTVVGEVRGMTGTYFVRIDSLGSTCTCPARVRCSHVYALAIAAGFLELGKEVNE